MARRSKHRGLQSRGFGAQIVSLPEKTQKTVRMSTCRARVLVNMPLASLRWPHLGLSLLKAALARAAVACDVAYFNFDFAELLGAEHYHWLADHFAFVLGGERLFAKHYFADRLPTDADYYRDVLLPADPGMTAADYQALVDTGRHIGPFLDACLSAVDWSRYDVVGFTTSFQQTMPSLCLAQRLKRLRPDIRVAFGGAACEGCMGPELMRQFPEIDYVFSGEADRTFPETVQRIIHEGHEGHEGHENEEEDEEEREGKEEKEEREGKEGDGGRCIGWESGMVDNLDELPYPDFDDYFARLGRSPLRTRSTRCWSLKPPAAVGGERNAAARSADSMATGWASAARRPIARSTSCGIWSTATVSVEPAPRTTSSTHTTSGRYCRCSKGRASICRSASS